MSTPEADGTIALPRLPPRGAESHKGTFGRALLIGGSRGMAGAIGLAGMAALRGGAGLVELAVPASCLSSVAAYEPSYLTFPLGDDEQGQITNAAMGPLTHRIEIATAVACGPGLGRSPQLAELVHWLYHEVDRPMVLDADAIFSLAGRMARRKSQLSVRILTPHPGEFRRLIRLENTRERAALEQLAIEFAQEHQVILVLKGHETLITDGQTRIKNSTGNPGMATGGSGDVLTGLITALLCQGMVPLDAARLGVYLHGLAGDLAAAELGQISLIASDLVRYLPQAFLKY